MENKLSYAQIDLAIRQNYDYMYDIFEYKNVLYEFMGAAYLAGTDQPRFVVKYQPVDTDFNVEFVRDLEDFFAKFKLVKKLDPS